MEEGKVMVITGVTKVTVTPEGKTEHKLEGDELKQWLKNHGYTVAEAEDDNTDDQS